MRMNDFWSQKGLCMNPALSLSSCVSSGKSLYRSEPRFSCLYNGCMQCFHSKSPVKTKLDREIKYLCYSIDVSRIGLFKMVHRIRTENLSQRKAGGQGYLLVLSLGTVPGWRCGNCRLGPWTDMRSSGLGHKGQARETEALPCLLLPVAGDEPRVERRQPGLRRRKPRGARPLLPGFP